MDARNTQHHAYAGPDKRAEQPGVQGNPRAIDEPAEHVTAQLVAAQQQLRAGRGIDESRVRLGGGVRRNKRRKDSDDDEGQGDYGPKNAQRLSPGKAAPLLPDGPPPPDGPPCPPASDRPPRAPPPATRL